MYKGNVDSVIAMAKKAAAAYIERVRQHWGSGFESRKREKKRNPDQGKHQAGKILGRLLQPRFEMGIL